MDRAFLCVVALLTAVVPSLGQELLSNPSFEDPAVSGPCAWDNTTEVPPWKRGQSGGVDRPLISRNEYVSGWYQPTCPRVPGDTAYASRQAYSSGAWRPIYQTVTGLTPGRYYAFTGFWSMGHQAANGDILCKAELYDGVDFNAPLIASISVNQPQGWQNWLPFGVVGAPTGTTMTVLVSAYNTGDAVAWCLFVDACSLVETACTGMPTVTNVTPTFGVRGATANMTVNGSGFVSGQTSVTLSRPDESWPGPHNITATNVVVAPDGNSLTCDFDLTGAANGSRNVVVMLCPPGCPCMPAMKLNAFLVVLPSLSNGSFELPTAAGGCPVTPLPDRPTDWLVTPIANYADGGGNTLFRDSDRFPPACPPPDGVHYGSSISNVNAAAGAEAHLYETISVTPGAEYNFSGVFAGGGRNDARIELYDGDQTGTLLSSTMIYQGSSIDQAYDWTPAYVVGTPTQEYMTLVWRINLTGQSPHAAHADRLAVDVCSPTGTHPAIYTNSPLPPGTCGEAYSFQLLGCALGNATWSVVAGELPWGLRMDAAGLISGIPIVPGAQFTAQIHDDYDGGTATKELQIPLSGYCCYDPPADLDGDQDVDQEDFGLFQLCYTGVGGGVLEGCTCADLDLDGLDVDQADLIVFELCASGPGVPPDPACR